MCSIINQTAGPRFWSHESSVHDGCKRARPRSTIRLANFGAMRLVWVRA
jgi:hypothetical protein